VVLPKAAPEKAVTVGEVPDAHGLASRLLHLGDGQHPLTASHEHLIVLYGDDRTTFGAF
jgi:hypothetical protein